MSGRRPWGWHRLDPYWAEQIVATAAIRPGELVVDLGAGTGALTVPLVQAGARVIAVELHPGRARQARASHLTAADLVLQRAVIGRVVDYGRKDLRRFQASRGLPLPRKAFIPPPPVDSAVLQLQRRKR